MNNQNYRFYGLFQYFDGKLPFDEKAVITTSEIIDASRYSFTTKTAMEAIITACYLYLYLHEEPEEQNWETVEFLLANGQFERDIHDRGLPKTSLDKLFEHVQKKDIHDICVRFYRAFRSYPVDIQQCAIANASVTTLSTGDCVSKKYLEEKET